MKSWMIVNVIRCPDSGARNSDLSAGIGQSRQAVTAFLRRTSVKLSYIFKLSEPGTTGAMEESRNPTHRWVRLLSTQNIN